MSTKKKGKRRRRCKIHGVELTKVENDCVLCVEERIKQERMHKLQEYRLKTSVNEYRGHKY